MYNALAFTLLTISLGSNYSIWQATIIQDSKSYISNFDKLEWQVKNFYLSLFFRHFYPCYRSVKFLVWQSFSREDEMFSYEIWKLWLWMSVYLNSLFVSPAVCLYRYFSLTWHFTTEDGLPPVICAYCFDSVVVSLL